MKILSPVKSGIALLASAALSGLLGAAISFAATECTQWMKQSDGTYWRICVDDKGHRSCQQKDCESCKAKEVRCS